jgi:transcriptional regulator with XRE-family HTH domain
MTSGGLAPSVGDRIREWRQRRRMSQLGLACEAEISTRHLSFLETGRAVPSREMVLRLAERLEVPVRERNTLLLAAGYAPMFSQRPFDAPELTAARAAIDLALASQKPYPAFAVDRCWRIMATNGALPQIYAGVAAELLEPPINVMRLSLHPQGLAPRIVNFAEWAGHLLHRLRQQVEATADPELAMLLKEMNGYVSGPGHEPVDRDVQTAVLIPLKLSTQAGVISLFTTTMVFGSPVDVTLAELAIELFFPMDAETAERVRELNGATQSQ